MEKELNRLGLEKLQLLYGIVNEICSDYAKMTDNYSLATGDNKFENIPQDIREMIKDRQKFFSYKITLKNVLADKVTKELEKYGL